MREVATSKGGEKTNLGTVANGPSLEYWDDDVAVGSQHRLLFCVWRARTTVNGVRKAHSVLRECLRGSVDGWALVTIIEPDAKMPEPGSREVLAQLLKGLSDRVVISGVAFEGDGFVAASVRGIVMGLTAMARQPFPHRVFASIKELALWFESKAGEVGGVFPAAQTILDVSDFRQCLRTEVLRRLNTTFNLDGGAKLRAKE